VLTDADLGEQQKTGTLLVPEAVDS
jgi:hypothetical protein